MQERVHVAVAMRLGLQRVRVVLRHRQVRVVVRQAGNLFLLDECYLIRGGAKVRVALEQRQRLGLRVVRGHDGERDAFPLAGARLQRQDGVHVELQVGRVRCALAGKLYLDAGVPEPLAEPAGDEHERGVADLIHAPLLQRDVRLVAVLDDDAVRHGGGPPVERVHALLGVAEQLLGVRDVRRDAAGVARVAHAGLRQETLLVVVLLARPRPAREQVLLPAPEQDVDHGVLIRGEHGAVRLEGGFRLTFFALSRRVCRRERRDGQRRVWARARCVERDEDAGGGALRIPRRTSRKRLESLVVRFGDRGDASRGPHRGRRESRDASRDGCDGCDTRKLTG